MRHLRFAALVLTCAGCSSFGQMDASLYAFAKEAMDPRTSPDRLRAIVRTGDPRLEEKMYGSDEQLGKNRKGLSVLRLIVQNPNVTEDTLALIAESKNEYVIGDVLGHPRTPQAILEKYSPGQNQLWDWGLAHNRSTRPETLTRLAMSGDEYTRNSVAANPSTPPETLRSLARDPVPGVRLYLATNPSLDMKTRTMLAHDEDPRVRNVIRRR
jgi:hypothetical protein